MRKPEQDIEPNDRAGVERHGLFQRLYACTQKIFDQVQHIHASEEGRDADAMEQLHALVTERGHVIDELQRQIGEHPTESPALSADEIRQMKRWEEQMEPQLQDIRQRLAARINRLERGKKLARHYQSSYGLPYTDGAYFDRKK